MSPFNLLNLFSVLGLLRGSAPQAPREGYDALRAPCPLMRFSKTYFLRQSLKNKQTGSKECIPWRKGMGRQSLPI